MIPRKCLTLQLRYNKIQKENTAWGEGSLVIAIFSFFKNLYTKHFDNTDLHSCSVYCFIVVSIFFILIVI